MSEVTKTPEQVVADKFKSLETEVKAGNDRIEQLAVELAKGEATLEDLNAQLKEIAAKGEDAAALARELNEKMGQFGQDKKSDAVDSVEEGVAKAFEAFEGGAEAIVKALKMQSGGVALSAKVPDAVGYKAPFLLSSSLTGDPMATYGTRQGIAPAQRVNIRDYIPTIQTATGLYVTYREVTQTGAAGKQTEGATKAEIKPALTEVKTVQDYIAAWTDVSKQAINSLPFLMGTLTRILTRDFFMTENELFVTQMVSVGQAETVAADKKVLKMLELIGKQNAANYTATVGFVSWTDFVAMQMELFTNQHYMGAGAVAGSEGGALRLMGTPIIPATFMADNEGLVYDADFVERVEREALNITMSYENADNFVKNIVTVKIEAQEALAVLRADAIRTADLTTA